MLRNVICFCLIFSTTQVIGINWNPFIDKVLAKEIFVVYKQDFKKAKIKYISIQNGSKKTLLKKHTTGYISLIKQSMRRPNRDVIELSIKSTDLNIECCSGSFYSDSNLFVSGNFTICRNKKGRYFVQMFKYDIKPIQ